MGDKLLVEIELHNGLVDDALPGLIFLTNEICESGVFEVGARSNWREKLGGDYAMKWKFTEEEEPPNAVPVDLDDLFELEALIKKLPSEESRNFLHNKILDYIKCAEMTLLCGEPDI